MGRSSGSEDEETCQRLANDITEKLKRSVPEYSSRRCIYRIPKLLRKTNEEAFRPVLVSIGPLHHHTHQRLVDMEPHKLGYLGSFLQDSNNPNPKQYLEKIKEKEKEIRECYADPIPNSLTSSDKFTEMVLTDSTFLIELLRKATSKDGVDDDPIWGYPHLLNEVLRDIMLAENQLPFFIIEELYQAAFGSNIAWVVDEFLSKYYFTSLSKMDPNHYYKPGNKHSLHLLDLLRSHYNPAGHIRPRRSDDHDCIGVDNGDWMTMSLSAAKLHEANVRFDGSDQFSSCLLHISFNKGKLTIPKLVIGGRTESLLRNLIALEQCQYPHDPFVTDYVFFLGCLIKTPEDVQVLVKAEIIDNLLGSNNSLSNLFNTLCDNVYVIPHQYCYQDITQQIIRHYKSPWNHYKAVLKHRHLTHPWTVILLVYAVLLLVLTLAQVVLGIVSLHLQPRFFARGR